jgi:hypothetical protein
LSGGSTETYDYFRFQLIYLSVQPGAAGADFGSPRLLVDSSLPTFGRNPFEMFYSVGHINGGTIDTGLG